MLQHGILARPPSWRYDTGRRSTVLHRAGPAAWDRLGSRRSYIGSDVTSVQRTPREAIRCGFFYAAGHAATVGLLGIAVIMLRQSLPDVLSVWMQRFIGLTLVLLGAYVLSVLFSKGQMVGRGQAIAAILHGRAEAGAAYSRKSSLSLGVLHGIGAETPTQLSMLMIAANVSRVQSGLLVLGVFAAAMLLPTWF